MILPRKVEALALLQSLGLPTVFALVFSPRENPEGRMEELAHHVSCWLGEHGHVSIRTDAPGNRAGSTPFLFMESSFGAAMDFCRAHQDLWLIVCRSVPPEDVLVQAHVELRDVWGRLRLWGEANDRCTRSCREAVACGTPESGLRSIRHPDMWQYNDVWAGIWRLLRERGLVNRMAEVTVQKDRSLVFWEV